MNGDQQYQQERQNLMTRLLDSVKQCQIRFGGKTELATEGDSRVNCLCQAWESVLQHGQRHNRKALSTLKQVTELTGITRIGSGISLLEDIKNMETEPCFWHYIKECLSRHEVNRYNLLKAINTDSGRGRAWLRSTLNEHSLERYMHILLENDKILQQHYEEWSFIRDQERSSMLPNMAAGLGSILFAISIDNSEFNSIRPAAGLEAILSSTPLSSSPPRSTYLPRAEDEPRPVIASDNSPQMGRKKEKKKKKKMAQVVSFDEDDLVSSYSASPSSSVTSPLASTSTTEFSLPSSVLARTLPELSSLNNNKIKHMDNKVTDFPPIECSQKDTQFENARSETHKSEQAACSQDNISSSEMTSSAITDLSEASSCGRIADGMREVTKFDDHTLQLPSPLGSLSSSPADYSPNIGSSAVSLASEAPVPPNHSETCSLHSDTSSYVLSPGSDAPSPASLTATVALEKKHTRHSSLDSFMSKIKSTFTGIDKSSFSISKTPIPTTEGSQDSTEGRTNVTSDKPTFPGRGSVSSLREMGRTFSQSSANSALSEASYAEEAQEENMTLTPINSEGKIMDDAIVVSVGTTLQSSSGSDLSEMPSYSEATARAAKALVLAQTGLAKSESLRTQGDGSHAPEPASPSHDTMTTRELKQAVIAMMMRKDEVEEQNKMLHAMLESETEMGSTLRVELDEQRKAHLFRQEKDADRLRALTRENDLLKHQLKKYVSAVQMLRSQGAKPEDFPGIHLDEEVPASIPPPKPSIDYSHEAAEYEKKLVQVAEMHGELLEFNEVLQKSLVGRDVQLRHLREELVSLRGPLPVDDTSMDNFSLASTDTDLNPAHTLISVWIPSAFLRGTGSDAFHVYQVYVRIRDEEWNVYHRYSEFKQLHITMRKQYPVVTTLRFPPKKAIGHKDAKFVETRRRMLQTYLRSLLNVIVHLDQDLVNNTSRQKLTQTISFFGDNPNEKKSKNKRSTSSRAGGGANTRHSEIAPSQSSDQQYMGL